MEEPYLESEEHAFPLGDAAIIDLHDDNGHVADGKDGLRGALSLLSAQEGRLVTVFLFSFFVWGKGSPRRGVVHDECRSGDLKECPGFGPEPIMIVQKTGVHGGLDQIALRKVGPCLNDLFEATRLTKIANGKPVHGRRCRLAFA